VDRSGVGPIHFLGTRNPTVARVDESARECGLPNALSIDEGHSRCVPVVHSCEIS
jgi:hypothetical protein